MHPDWQFPDGVTYLNHGSFGPAPAPVVEARGEWLSRLNANPMDFYLRKLPGELDRVLERLAEFLGCPAGNLALMTNATSAMNVVANNILLDAGDEVLLTDHEYGAVVRLWGRRCAEVGAKTVLARLPLPLNSPADVLEAIVASFTPRTRVLVVSHVTSPTAVILPVREICEAARERGIISVVDGPHAVGMLDLDLKSIPCDFYAASCHKWLSAPLGTGFLHVRGRYKQGLRPTVTSWGRNFRGAPPDWRDEFHWPGTFDPTSWLTIPAAIDYLRRAGLDPFRNQCGALALAARRKLEQLPVAQDGLGWLLPQGKESEWSGTMAAVPLDLPPMELPPGAAHPLQRWLWEQKRTEIPVMAWRDRMLLRVSCHLYNTAGQIDQLVSDVAEWWDQHQSTKTKPG